jgi:hypothetical protein
MPGTPRHCGVSVLFAFIPSYLRSFALSLPYLQSVTTTAGTWAQASLHDIFSDDDAAAG